MKKKIPALALCALFALSVHAEAQPTKKIHQIGYLSAQPASRIADSTNTFLRGLGEIGYIEGKNIAIEYRWAEGKIERLPDRAAELVRLRVDVILAVGGTPTIRAAKNATSAIPIFKPSSTEWLSFPIRPLYHAISRLWIPYNRSIMARNQTKAVCV